jgi:hypothetical protein
MEDEDLTKTRNLFSFSLVSDFSDIEEIVSTIQSEPIENEKQKSIINWVNSQLNQREPPEFINNLNNDIKSSIKLLHLLEVRTILILLLF